MLRKQVMIVFVLGVFVLSGFGCSSPSPFATADGTITHISKELGADKPEVLWDAMPASYQADITRISHEFASKMDAELYSTFVGVLQKTVELLETKKAIILESSFSNNPFVDKESITQEWDAMVGLLSTIVNSELGDLEKLGHLDTGKFLAGTGHSVMVQMDRLSTLFPDKFNKDYKALLAGLQVEVVSQDADSAVVKITVPDEPPKEIKLVLIEERWVPEELPGNWADQMAEIDKKLATWDEEKIAETRIQALMSLNMVETFLDQLAKVATAEEFDQAIGAAMSGMLGGR